MVRAAVICWALFAAISAWMISGGSAAFDAAGMWLWRNANGAALGPGWLQPFWHMVTVTGAGLFRDAIAIVAVIAVLTRKRWALAANLLVAVFTAGPIDTALKSLFARPRPDIVPHLVGADGFAFPSGHSFGAASTYLAVALALGALTGRTRPLLAVGLAWAAAVAFSRVWLGVHWPTDALAGFVGGLGWTLAVFAAGEHAASRISAPEAAKLP